jgi:hypothetical protein
VTIEEQRVETAWRRRFFTNRKQVSRGAILIFQVQGYRGVRESDPGMA